MANKKVQDKLKNKIQVTGAVEVQQSLDDVIGRSSFPYKQKTQEDYAEYLRNMTFADLQKHSVEIAKIVPSAMNKDRLIYRLQQEFAKKKNSNINQRVENKISKEDEEAIKNLLRR